MDVARPLPLVHISGAPAEWKLRLWLGGLAGLAALNVGLWLSIAASGQATTPYARTQLVLAGIYVAVCSFRSLFPRVDLERVCVWDTWLSAIVLGRTLATVAEMCFAVQCALFVHRLAEVAGLPPLAAGAQTLVPLAAVAQTACWYAVLSLNHAFHAVEEVLWAAIMLILSAATGAAALVVDGPPRLWLSAIAVAYAGGAILTIAVDVRMYVRRWRTHAAGARLPLAAGLRDSGVRRRPRFTWAVWREEAPWMTVYFSVGVWTSLAMILLI
jgi:hypothetical protein